MTKLLEEALDRVRKLPPQEQDLMAHLLLEELDSEQRWDALLARTSDRLDVFAERAIAANRRGETEALDPDQL